MWFPRVTPLGFPCCLIGLPALSPVWVLFFTPLLCWVSWVLDRIFPGFSFTCHFHPAPSCPWLLNHSQPSGALFLTLHTCISSHPQLSLSSWMSNSYLSLSCSKPNSWSFPKAMSPEHLPPSPQLMSSLLVTQTIPLPPLTLPLCPAIGWDEGS
jgi:hypothetical protein